jgi:tetratricopeptide (TPR) repeat protein
MDVGNAAFARGDMQAALAAYRACVAALEPVDDHIAPLCYENLGLACHNLGRWHEAARAFRRALDGDPASRQQSCSFLVVALARLGRSAQSAQLLQIYQDAFGDHPTANLSG